MAAIFFTPAWADDVCAALNAGPDERALADFNAALRRTTNYAAVLRARSEVYLRKRDRARADAPRS